MIAAIAAAVVCAVPVKASMSYIDGEVVVSTKWQAASNHRATIANKLWVNGRLLMDDVARDLIMASYEHEMIAGVTNKPRWSRAIVTIKSSGCTRSAVLFRRFS